MATTTTTTRTSTTRNYNRQEPVRFATSFKQSTRLNNRSNSLISLLLIAFLYTLCTIQENFALGAKRDYYYTRTRLNPQHLRFSEEFKNNYLNEIKLESKINGTNYEYYKSSLVSSHDEMVFEAIDKIFKHRLSPFYIHHYDNEEDKRRSSDPKLVSQEACARDLMYLAERVPKEESSALEASQRHLTPELEAFFDSYGRQEAGLLMGNTYWVGGYDQCVNRHIFDLQEEFYAGGPQAAHKLSSPLEQQQQRVINFKGRYCVSSLKSASWNKLIKSKRLEGNRNYFKTKQQTDDYSKLFRLQVGVCLPSSCDSNSLARHSEEIKLLTTAQLNKRYQNYQLIDLYCLPDESSPLRSFAGSSLYFLMFMAAWATLLLLATLADVLEFVDLEGGGRRMERFVNWFSLRANYRKFMKVSSEEEVKRAVKEKQEEAHMKVNLRFLNAFKTLIMFWIVTGHIMLLMIQTAKNILYSDALLNSLMHFLIGATFGVDLFFTMTGFLTAYLLFDSGRRLNLLTWLFLSFHRYWRLAPMYLLAFWFSRSVVHLLGSGPLWDYGTSAITFRGLCNNESWLYPLTLTSNLHGLFEECMITSWYISCDMQFWLVSPIFLQLLSKWPVGGWLASLAAIGLSAWSRYETILAEKAARYDELVQPRADIFMRVSHDLPALYTYPHTRISAYIVGLLAGHYVYMVKSGKWRSSIVRPLSNPLLQVGESAASAAGESHKKLSTQKEALLAGLEEGFGRRRAALAYAGLALFLVMSFVSYLLANYFPSSLLESSKSIAAIAYSVDHLVMSVGASLVVVSMCFGQWPQASRFLSSPNWTRLSKMNYALLLLQCEAIYFQIFRYEQVPVAGTRELLNILFNLLVTLYPAAFAITLAFEFPLANIEKLLL